MTIRAPRSLAEASTIGDIAATLNFPKGALQQTVAYYNLHAANGEDPMFRKSRAYLRPLQGPPFKAWDLSATQAFFPAHTFGGLHTTVDGQVLNSFGEMIPGLYAAGRDETGDAFTKRVRMALRKVPKGPLRKRIDLELWPAAPLMPSRPRHRWWSAAIHTG